MGKFGCFSAVGAGADRGFDADRLGRLSQGGRVSSCKS